VEKRSAPSFAWFYFVALLAVLVLLVAGVLMLHAAGRHGQAWLVAAAVALGSGGLGYIGLLIASPILLSINRANQFTAKHQDKLLTAVTDRLQQISVMMNIISEQQLISDRAKAVAFRDKDRETVRRALREEIARQDWEAGLLLANDMEKEFGYRQEADRFRDEILAKRGDIQRKQIADAMVPVNRYVQAEAWGSAMQEAQKIMAQFPDDQGVQRLGQEIETHRQSRKKQLLDDWQLAVSRHDVDGGIEILKNLDLYLTPAEATAMQAEVRGVFKEKRDDLRVRFSLAVQEHRWAEAFKLGDEIIQEFPNTRIAQEVSEKMEALRKLATQPAAGV